MNSKLRIISSELRAKDSAQAVSWLVSTYPISSPEYGDVFQLLGTRSWKRADQIRLARYYLQNMPFACARPYEVFVAFMSLKLFISVLREFMPKSKADADLLIYHVKPVLEKAAQTRGDHEEVDDFLCDLLSI